MDCEFSGTSPKTYAAIVGNGNIGGVLTITGTTFGSTHAAGINLIDNTAVANNVQKTELKKVIFNNNRVLTATGGVEFHGMETAPMTSCEFLHNEFSGGAEVLYAAALEVSNCKAVVMTGNFFHTILA
jgi:hypothetical protein